SRRKPFRRVRRTRPLAPVGNDPSERSQMRDRAHLSRTRTRSRLPDTALKFQNWSARRPLAFAPDNSRSMSAHAADRVLRLMSDNSVRHKTSHRLSCQRPLTPVQIQVVAPGVLAAPESSCATRDAGVANEEFAYHWRADASRKPDPRFCTGIA